MAVVLIFKLFMTALRRQRNGIFGDYPSEYSVFVPLKAATNDDGPPWWAQVNKISHGSRLCQKELCTRATCPHPSMAILQRFTYNVAMGEVILKTKLNIPPLRPSLIRRELLFERLNDRLLTEDGLFNRKLTLISAPPGFGKTTLASSWIHQLERPTAWLSLDEGDNDLNRFMLYLIAALQGSGREVGEATLSLLQSAQSPPQDTLLTLLVNDLASLRTPVILVLDDYHVIHNLRNHEAITFLLENQLPQLHLVLVSREDPPLPLHRLRGGGQMAGIYARDLRFTRDQSRQFLNGMMGLSLSPDEIAVLAQRTEGWVAGLQLAALSMRDLADTREFVMSFAGDDRYIADYLMGEVVDRQPPRVQEFLSRVAIVDRFCASLCDALMEVGERATAPGEPADRLLSRTIIERLDQSNLFMIPLDNKREWYRFHHLFTDFLRLRWRERPADEFAKLHRRAAAWYEDHGLLAESIQHALAGEDFLRAGRLIEENALRTIFGHAQWATLLEWMAALPDDLVRSRPRLSLSFAWTLFSTGRWEDAEPYLRRVELAIGDGEVPAKLAWMLGEVATIRALVAHTLGDVERCKELSHRAVELLPDDNSTVRAVATLAQGMARLWGGDADSTRQLLRQSVVLAQAAGNVTVALFALGYWMHLEIREGRLHKAAELYQQARQLGTLKGGILLGPAGFACVQMGEVLREWNELEQAKEVLLEGMKLSQQQTGMRGILLEGKINLARVLLASGEHENATETLPQVESLIAKLLGRSADVLPTISMALAFRLRFWLAQGALGQTDEWLASNGICVDADISPEYEEFYVVLVRVLIQQDRLDEADKLLKRLSKVVKKSGLRVEMLILEALLSRASGEAGRAVTVLSQALRLAEPEGYLRLFVDQDKAIIPLLEQAARRSAAPANLKPILTVLARHPHVEEGATVMGPTPESPALVEALKDKELRILRLMAAGLSNRQIADELFLSHNTVKVYASRIYSKLDVHSRVEAVIRAQDLGLV